MEFKKLKVGLITTVSGRWPKELPKQRHDEYSQWLTDNFTSLELIKPDKIAVNNSDVQEIAEYFKREMVDLVILLIGAFSGDYFATHLSETLNVPLILWAPHEPPFNGTRLIANSLVAGTMNAAALYRLGSKYHFIYGNQTELRVQKEVSSLIRVYNTLKQLKQTYLGMMGYRPVGFYSSIVDETLLRQKFGVRVEECSLNVLFDRADKIEPSRVAEDLATVKTYGKVKDLPEGHLENHARLTLAMEEIIAEQGFDAISFKCWPEMGERHCTPCGMISRFADRGFIIGCESDLDTTVTMLIQKYLTGKTTFMCDLVDVNEAENTVLLWHCGQAAQALKDPNSELEITNHPLAGQGVAFQTTLQSGKVTIARLSKIGNDYKLFVITGEAIPTQKMVTGVSVNVVLDKPVIETIYRIAETGVAHHYTVVWEDVAEEMKLLAKILDIEVISL